MTKRFNNFIITIDGPAAAGKSTVARNLAGKLGFHYLDTGALYRAFTLKVLQTLKLKSLDGINLDFKRLASLLKKTGIRFQNKSGRLRVMMNGRDVTAEIRKPYVTASVYRLAESPLIRPVMVKLQRSLARPDCLAPMQSGLVAEGRDLGTVVFPKADIKFYLDASLSERAKRRLKELNTAKPAVNRRQLFQEIKQRDRRDKTRLIAPLKQAPDAVYINTTNLPVNEVVNKLLDVVKRVFWMKFIPERNRI